MKLIIWKEEIIWVNTHILNFQRKNRQEDQLQYETVKG